MRETRTELTAHIICAVSDLEPHLTTKAIRRAVESASLSTPQLQRLARTLRQDPTVLTGPAGGDCIADIEPVVTAIKKIGGTAVRLPTCARCKTSDSETYSRQLRKRICRACATQRWRAPKGKCVNCGEIGVGAYRARCGGLLCRRCRPEPDVDHAAEMREGIEKLGTGLSRAEIDSVASTFRSNVAQRDLNWIVHDNPEVFSGDSPHRSVHSVRLAGLLIEAGAVGVRVPQCPFCRRDAPLAVALNGLRCCRRCWNQRHRWGECARCGRHRHLTHVHGAGQRICGSCFTGNPVHHHPCTKCGRVDFITHRDGQVKLCRRCHRAPTSTCSSCGRVRPCDRIKTGAPICATCAGKQRTREACSRCHRPRLVQIRTEAGEPICANCGRRREPCCRCGVTRAVAARLDDVGPLCEHCLEKEPAYFCDCVRCGTHGRAYHHGLCPACALPGVLRRMFGKDDHFGGAAHQVAEALLKCDAISVLRWAARTNSRGQLAAGIRDLGDSLTHDALDNLPPSKSVEWLRNILVEADVLPPRDPYLRRTELFIHARLKTLNSREDRTAARAFTEWHHLRQLREQADRAPLKRGHGLGAQHEITAITAFLIELESSGLTLASCRQTHVDDWLVRNPTLGRIHHFLAWAVKRGHAHDVIAPTPQTRRTRHTLPGDDERWRLIQHLIEFPDLQTRDRAAGLLVLLYSQQTSRLVTLRVSDVTIAEDRVTLALGDVPLLVPPPVDRLLTDLVELRRGYAAVDVGTNPWLFPGGRSGTHLSSSQMGVRLRRIGIPPRLARNTALIDLAGELPAVVLAKLLGFSVKRAVTWNAEAGNTYPRYSAAVVRQRPGQRPGHGQASVEFPVGGRRFDQDQC